MCGIAGIAQEGVESRELSGTLSGMIRPLAPRGPDGEGSHVERGVALGHRRLAIVDLSERARQPISNEDGSVWLACNGEIYNHLELRALLEQRGHVFRSRSDCEVLVHLYEENLDNLPEIPRKLRGMFAFALWDSRRRRWVLGRDRLGIKPLFYFERNGLFAFGSTLDALAAHPEVPRRIDWTSVYEYLLLLTVPGPTTIYRDIFHLPPGSLLVRENGLSRLVNYWRIEHCAQEVVDGEQEALARIEGALADSVAAHLLADVEVGAFLSGGIDSGLVTAFAQARCAGRLRSFCATFPGEDVDEGPWADKIASTLGTQHSTLPVTAGLLGGLPEAIEAMDQPMALPSAVSLFHLSRLARQHVKVVLTGDGGDEVLAGYSRHRPFRSPIQRLKWLPLSLTRSVARIGRALLPGPRTSFARPLERLRNASDSLARDEAELYVPRLFAQPPADALSLLPAEAREVVDRSRYLERVRSVLGRCGARATLARLLVLDLATSLGDEMLAKVDRMTMAHGLEARVPLLDHELVEAALAISSSLKRQGSQGKLLFRRLAARTLGEEVAHRPKSGFNSPVRWLAQEPVTRRQVDALWPSASAGSFFDPVALARLRPSYDDGPGKALPFFAALVLGLWIERRGVGR